MLAPPDPAPDFEVLDHNSRSVRSADLLGTRYLLWFFPKASAPSCSAMAAGFRDLAGEFATKGVRVFGASFDSVEENHAFARELDLAHPLLCDVSRGIGLGFGACESPGDDFARPCAFVVGADGKVEHSILPGDPAALAAELLTLL